MDGRRTILVHLETWLRSYFFRNKTFLFIQDRKLKFSATVGKRILWKGRQMTNLVSNFEYLLLLCFLTAAKFWNLGHLQGIIRVPQLKRYNFEWVGLLSDLILMSAEKKIKTNIQNLTLNSLFDVMSKWHDPHKTHNNHNPKLSHSDI